MIDLRQGDCLELMNDIPDKSVDMILCDLPYGTTQCKWDKTLELNSLWKEYNRIIKDNGAIALFAQLPFGADLIYANKKYFRYEWIWDKRNSAGFLNANRMPLRRHENILIFYKRLPTYNPQYGEGKPYRKNHGKARVYNYFPRTLTENDGKRFPTDIISMIKVTGGALHPTQKPVELCEYLIKTYTTEGETVLDNCMGSGTTGVACVNTGRNFIGIELDEKYFEIAKGRIQDAEAGL